MPFCFPADVQATVAAALLGVADVDDGPTEEQLGVVGTLAHHLWSVDLDGSERLDPGDLAAARTYSTGMTTRPGGQINHDPSSEELRETALR